MSEEEIKLSEISKLSGVMVVLGNASGQPRLEHDLWGSFSSDWLTTRFRFKSGQLGSVKIEEFNTWLKIVKLFTYWDNLDQYPRIDALTCAVTNLVRYCGHEQTYYFPSVANLRRNYFFGDYREYHNLVKLRVKSVKFYEYDHIPNKPPTVY